jgi:hypothetical protein
VPGIIEGTGVSGLNGDGIDLALAATLVPLQIGALAFVSYEDAQDFRKVLLGVGVDLPGPPPLANTGLGIFGLLGFFVVNGEPTPPGAQDDPIDHLLRWKPWEPGAFRPQRGELTFGIGAVVGTVPDLGFAFSSKAVLAVTVPDLAVRASLDATSCTSTCGSRTSRTSRRRQGPRCGERWPPTRAASRSPCARSTRCRGSC